jgi:hypothetical protein
MTTILAILLAFFGKPLFQRPAAPDTALLPPDGFLQSWKRAENPRVFTSSDLYGYIDGGAEIYLEFGFEQLTVQSYRPVPQSAADEFKAEIYRMADPVAAAGMYLMNCGKERPDPSFAERHTLNEFQLLFKRNRYYVVINNSEGNQKLRAAMLEFGRYIAARLPAEASIKLGEVLPSRGLDRTSIRFIRGPYALQAIYTLGEGDILELDRRVAAVSGRYDDAGIKYSLILVDYPTEEAAQKAFLNVQTHLDRYLNVQEKTSRRLVFKDYKNEYGVIDVASRRLTIQLHLADRPTAGVRQQCRKMRNTAI